MSQPSSSQPTSRKDQRDTRRPSRRTSRGLIAAGAAAALVVGYLAADIADIAPGVLTAKPPIEVQAVPRPVPGEMSAAAASDLDQNAPVPKDLEGVLNPIFDDDRLTGKLGAEVRDAITGDVLYARDAQGQKTPASVTKVLTGAAALGALGEESRFRTTAALDGTDLYLIGGGDVLLGAGESNPDAISGHAGLATLAQEAALALKERGQTAVTLHADLSRYDGPTFNSGWDRADIGNGYITDIVPLMVNSGLVSSARYSPRHAQPQTVAADAFAKALDKAGITVKTGDEAPSPEGAEELAAVESAPVGSMVRHMLLRSDNVVAEVLGREVARARQAEPSGTASPQEVTAQLADMGLDTGSITIKDTSGLDYANRISPHDLTGIVEAALTRNELAGLVPNFPVGALSGTLAERYEDDDSQRAAGLVQAKTGTLSTVTSLSGVVLSADGRLLAFSFMADGLKKGSSTGARTVVDNAVAALAGCGCSQ